MLYQPRTSALTKRKQSYDPPRKASLDRSNASFKSKYSVAAVQKKILQATVLDFANYAKCVEVEQL